MDTLGAPFGTYRPSSLFMRFRRLALGASKTSFLSKLLRRLLASFSKRIGQPIDIEHSGLKLRLYPDDNYQDRWILKMGRHPEESELSVFDGYAGRDVTFVDIGANVGYITLRAQQIVGQHSKLISIEPHPQTFKKLNENLAFNAALNVQTFQLAVGAEVATLPLYEVAGNEGENSLHSHGEHSCEAAVSVDVVPLSNILLMANVTAIDILKIDVEGYEDEALLSYFKSAMPERWPERIAMETSQADRWRQDVVQELLSLGYCVVHDDPPNLILQFEWGIKK